MKWIFLFISTIQFTNSWAQHIKVGIIDFYGNRKVPEVALRQKLLFREGDSLTYEQAMLRRDSAVRLLKTIPQMRDAVFGFVCCDDKHGQWPDGKIPVTHMLP